MQPEQVTVRRAATDDVDELIRLRELMYDALEGVMDTTAGWQEPCHAIFTTGIADGSFAAFVIDDPDGGGRLAACGVAMVAQRLPGPGNHSGRYGYVQSMATDLTHRRKGMARVIFQALLDWFAAEGVQSIDLHASVEGEPLYRQFGFEEGETNELRWRARWFS